MAKIHDKIRASIEPRLDPGEKVQAVFTGQSHNPWVVAAPAMLGAFVGIRLFGILGAIVGAVLGIFIVGMFTTNYVIAATDRRIAVAEASIWQPNKAGEIVAELNRNTLIGPASGMWHKSEALGFRVFFIHRRFHDDVSTADHASRA